MQNEDASVARHDEFGGGYRLLVFDAPGISAAASPGQFVHIRVPGLSEAALRRPFSIYKAEAGQVWVMYKTVGLGTSALLAVKPGDVISLLGPLGRGFPVDHTDTYPVFVAGGYGVAPLTYLAAHMSSKGVAFLGARTAADILCVEDFERVGWRTIVATEDGTLGTKGRVTDVLDTWLEQYGGPSGGDRKAPVEYYACGPGGMLKAIGDRALAQERPAWLSLDKRMGCGVGACLACVQKVRGADGEATWARGCREGPVFDAREIIWDENE